MNRFLRLIALSLLGLLALPSFGATRSGAVLMHGQGETPAQVAELASLLQREGVLTVAPDLPWSGRNSYSRNVTDADIEIDAAIDRLKTEGVRNVYLVGQGLGASYALRYATRPGVSGVVAIAPNHMPEHPLFSTSFREELRRAREYIAQGKPQALLEFLDPGRGNLRSRASASAQSFLSYFDASGPMNMTRNAQALPPDLIVLWIVPTGDSRGMRNASIEAYERIPFNAGSKLMELPVDYQNVVGAAARPIVDWMQDSVPYLRRD